MKKLITTVVFATLFIPSLLLANHHHELYEQFTEENLIPVPEDGKSYVQVLYRTNLNFYHGADAEIGITWVNKWKDFTNGNKEDISIIIKEYVNEEGGNYLQFEFHQENEVNLSQLKQRIKSTIWSRQHCEALVDKMIETINLPLKSISKEDFSDIYISSSNSNIMIKQYGIGGTGKEIYDEHGRIYNNHVREMRQIIKECRNKQSQ